MRQNRKKRTDADRITDLEQRMDKTEAKVTWLRKAVSMLARLLPRSGKLVNAVSRELTKTQAALFLSELAEREAAAAKRAKAADRDTTPNPKTKHKV